MIKIFLLLIFTLLLCRLLQIWLKHVFNPIPSYHFTLRKDKNAEDLAKSFEKGNLPKIFRPDFFPFCSMFISNFYVITDFEFMKEAFSRKELSNRSTTEKGKIDAGRNNKFYKLDKIALEVLGPDDQLIKNGEQRRAGLPDGPYDDLHKKFRNMWYETSKNLAGRNKILEIIQSSSEAVNKMLFERGGKEGINPKSVFVNGTMNVITGFAFGTVFEPNDPTFEMLEEQLIKLFNVIVPMLVKKSMAGKLPLFISQNWLYQKIWKTTMDDHYAATQKIYRFVFENVVKHRATLDPSNPRDYLDMLLIEADSEPRIGWDSIGGTATIIYAAASDTLASTLTWLCSLLSDHPKVQERMHAEIENCLKSEGEIKKEKCPFTRSVLLENMRLNPVADIIPHEASEDSVVDGVLIKKGSTLYASLTAMMADPASFPEPSKFVPDRFYRDGEFVNDMRVCSFSIGLRNCIGKQIAIEEYFIFATNIIREFRILRTAGNMEIAEHVSMRIPKLTKMRFEKR